MPHVNVIERSVNTIQNIYAVIIALAIAEAAQSFLSSVDGHASLRPAWLLSGLPTFIAVLVTLVPFWHGMNRHLDRCYLEKKSGVAYWAIPLDFVIFLVEAAVLFAAALTLRSGIEAFICLGVLLGIDMLWAVISHQIHFSGHKSYALRWSVINIVAIALAVAVVVAYPVGRKTLLLMVLALLRTIVDYGMCRDFYFPATAP